MRGYFGIGAYEISKSYNVGSLYRSAHAFDANFFFTINSDISFAEMKQSDTSHAENHLPFYEYATLNDLKKPKGCKVIGIELTDDAVDLPSFCHPLRAIYLLGPERGSLPPEILAQCDFTIKIPTKFCINVGIAGALVMYDRISTVQKWAGRPVTPGGSVIDLPEHVSGGRVVRRKK